MIIKLVIKVMTTRMGIIVPYTSGAYSIGTILVTLKTSGCRQDSGRVGSSLSDIFCSSQLTTISLKEFSQVFIRVSPTFVV